MVRECVARWAVRVALCISLFVLYIFLINVIVVTVHFVSCSVKLPLSQTTSFAFFFPFSSPLQEGRGDRATAWSFVASHGPKL